MKTLLTGGTVVSMDPAVGDLDRGDVLIEDGVIVEVAGRIDAPDAEVIDATDRIVMPGFVDNHRHTWQTAFRGVGADWTFPEWAAAMHGTVKPFLISEQEWVLDPLPGTARIPNGFGCAGRPRSLGSSCPGAWLLATVRDEAAGSLTP
ncbi:hypothetical protein ACFV7R_44465, partial [Streptomyces sp. NPDC059866]